MKIFRKLLAVFLTLNLLFSSYLPFFSASPVLAEIVCDIPGVTETCYEVMPTPAPTCDRTPQFQYNECSGCNESKPVYRDGCGNWSYGGVQSDGACSGWCGMSESEREQERREEGAAEAQQSYVPPVTGDCWEDKYYWDPYANACIHKYGGYNSQCPYNFTTVDRSLCPDAPFELPEERLPTPTPEPTTSPYDPWGEMQSNTPEAQTQPASDSPEPAPISYYVPPSTFQGTEEVLSPEEQPAATPQSYDYAARQLEEMEAELARQREEERARQLEEQARIDAERNARIEEAERLRQYNDAFLNPASSGNSKLLNDCYIKRCDKNQQRKVCMQLWNEAPVERPGVLTDEPCDTAFQQSTASGECTFRRVNDKVGEECDTNLGEWVYIEQWQKTCDGVTLGERRPGAPTGRRCVQDTGLCQKARLATCYRSECGSDGVRVCIEQWRREDCTLFDNPGNKTGESCQVKATADSSAGLAYKTLSSVSDAEMQARQRAEAVGENIQSTVSQIFNSLNLRRELIAQGALDEEIQKAQEKAEQDQKRLQELLQEAANQPEGDKVKTQAQALRAAFGLTADSTSSKYVSDETLLFESRKILEPLGFQFNDNGTDYTLTLPKEQVDKSIDYPAYIASLKTMYHLPAEMPDEEVIKRATDLSKPTEAQQTGGNILTLGAGLVTGFVTGVVASVGSVVETFNPFKANERADEVNRLIDEAGIEKKGLLESLWIYATNMEDVFQGSMWTTQLGYLEEDKKLRPDDTLTPEQLAARQELERVLKRNAQQNEATLDFVGGFPSWGVYNIVKGSVAYATDQQEVDALKAKIDEYLKAHPDPDATMTPELEAMMAELEQKMAETEAGRNQAAVDFVFNFGACGLTKAVTKGIGLCGDAKVISKLDNVENTSGQLLSRPTVDVVSGSSWWDRAKDGVGDVIGGIKNNADETIDSLRSRFSGGKVVTEGEDVAERIADEAMVIPAPEKSLERIELPAGQGALKANKRGIFEVEGKSTVYTDEEAAVALQNVYRKGAKEGVEDIEPVESLDLNQAVSNSGDALPTSTSQYGQYYSIKPGDESSGIFIDSKIYLRARDQESLEAAVGKLRSTAPQLIDDVGLEMKFQDDLIIYVRVDPSKVSKEEMVGVVNLIQDNLNDLNGVERRISIRNIGYAQDPIGIKLEVQEGKTVVSNFSSSSQSFPSNDSLRSQILSRLDGIARKYPDFKESYMPGETMTNIVELIERNPAAKAELGREYARLAQVTFRDINNSNLASAIPIAVDLTDAKALQEAIELAIRLEKKGYKTALVDSSSLTAEGYLKPEIVNSSLGKYSVPVANVQKGETSAISAAQALEGGSPVYMARTTAAVAEDLTDNPMLVSTLFEGIPQETVKQARNLAIKISPSASEKEIELIAWRLRDGISEKEILNLSVAVDKTYKYWYEGEHRYYSGMPEDVKLVWNTFRYNGDFPYLDSPNRIQILDAVLRQKLNVKSFASQLQDTRAILEALENYAIKNGANAANLPDINNITDPRFIHIVPENTIQRQLPPGETAGGVYRKEDTNILIDNRHQFVTVCTHEELHRCFFTGLPEKGLTDEQLATSLGGEITAGKAFWANRNKFIEGLTEWTNMTGFNLLGKIREYSTYQDYVDAISRIEALLSQKFRTTVDKILFRTPSEKAKALLIETQMSGGYNKLFMILGDGDLAKGAEIVASYMNDLPATTSNVVIKKRVITKSDLVLAGLVVAETASIGGGGYVIYDQLIKDKEENNPQPSPTPKPQSWRLIPEVLAQENNKDDVFVIDQAPYELLIKKQLIKNALLEDGEVDSDFVKDVMQVDIFKAQMEQLSGGYRFTTGKEGISEGEIEEGRYLVNVSSLPGVDITVPKVIRVVKGKPAIVSVKIKKGSGKVEKRAFLPENTSGVVYAAEENSTTVKVAILSEKDKVLPWAGVSVNLVKLDRQETISLTAGWNLITLNTLPASSITASSLLSEIAKQGGYVTTVSTLIDGAWKSYVIRGDKTYSGEDFPIEVGKAYFVKSIKSSKVKFTGEVLLNPIKLDLASGWNAIGLPKTSKSYKAGEIIDKLNSNKAAAGILARWDFGLWDSFVKKSDAKYGENFVIENNRGYLIKIGEGGQFNP